MAPSPSPAARKLRNVFFVCMGFTMLGYAGWMFSGSAIIASALAAGAMIFVGGRCRSVQTGVILGLALGLLAGGGMVGAFARAYFWYTFPPESPASQPAGGPATAPATVPAVQPSTGIASPSEAPSTRRGKRVVIRTRPTTREILAEGPKRLPYIMAMSLLGTPILCGMVGGFYAHLAQRRRQRVNRRWDEVT